MCVEYLLFWAVAMKNVNTLNRIFVPREAVKFLGETKFEVNLPVFKQTIENKFRKKHISKISV